MNNTYMVKTASSLEYVFQAHHFQIHDQIVHFYDDEGEVVWVIKDWISFSRIDSKCEPSNPDEFYETIDKEES